MSVNYRRWNWTYVIGIYEDSSYGQIGFQAFERLAVQRGICFADRWKIDIDSQQSRNQTEYQIKLQDWAGHNTKYQARGMRDLNFKEYYMILSQCTICIRSVFSNRTIRDV